MQETSHPLPSGHPAPDSQPHAIGGITFTDTAGAGDGHSRARFGWPSATSSSRLRVHPRDALELPTASAAALVPPLIANPKDLASMTCASSQRRLRDPVNSEPRPVHACASNPQLPARHR